MTSFNCLLIITSTNDIETHQNDSLRLQSDEDVSRDQIEQVDGNNTSSFLDDEGMTEEDEGEEEDEDEDEDEDDYEDDEDEHQDEENHENNDDEENPYDAAIESNYLAHSSFPGHEAYLRYVYGNADLVKVKWPLMMMMTVY